MLIRGHLTISHDGIRSYDTGIGFETPCEPFILITAPVCCWGVFFTRRNRDKNEPGSSRLTDWPVLVKRVVSNQHVELYTRSVSPYSSLALQTDKSRSTFVYGSLPIC